MMKSAKGVIKQAICSGLIILTGAIIILLDKVLCGTFTPGICIEKKHYYSIFHLTYMFDCISCFTIGCIITDDQSF